MSLDAYGVCRLWKQHGVEAHTYKHEACLPMVKKKEKKIQLNSNDLGFICDVLAMLTGFFVFVLKKHHLSCLLKPYCC